MGDGERMGNIGDTRATFLFFVGFGAKRIGAPDQVKVGFGMVLFNGGNDVVNGKRWWWLL